MACDEDRAWRPGDLARDARQAQAKAKDVRAEVAKTAQKLAETEEGVAETMGRLAGDHPRHAPRLRALGQAAQAQAARARRWLDDH